MRILKIIIIPIFIFSSVYLHALYAEEDRALYRQAMRAVKEKNFNSAFMDFKIFLEENPESKLAEGALFALCEYYFENSDYYDAFYAFNRFLKEHPQSKARIFALVYLSEIARQENNQELAEKLEKAIISSEQIALLFRESKEFRFRSPFLKNYKAVYFIDRVEFYIDGTPFAQIHY